MNLRREPYTEVGIKRARCFRCGEKAVHQWNICADENVYRPICADCDVKLNAVVLRFMGFKDWKEKMKRYKERIQALEEDCDLEQN